MVSMHTSPVAAPGIADAGGLNVVITALAVELARRGVEVDLITRASGEPAVREVALGVNLHEIGPAGHRAKGELPALADAFGEGIADLARRRGYDVIHAHYWLSGLAALPVALELDVPLVQSFHTLAAMKNARLAPGDRPEPVGRSRTETYLAGQATAVIAGSTAEVTSLIDQVGAPAERLWVIPPGVDTTLFTPARAASAATARRRLGVPEGRPIVVMVGRVQPLKGQELAVRAVAALQAASAHPPVLVVAGEPTPGEQGYLARLRALAVELGVADSVRFVGALGREQLADALAAASVCLMPSHSETFGLVALESAASGTPVLGSGTTGLAESIAHGRSGILLDSRDPIDWARALSRLLEDPVRLGALSQSARRHAEQYSWASTGTALLAVYASL